MWSAPRWVPAGLSLLLPAAVAAQSAKDPAAPVAPPGYAPAPSAPSAAPTAPPPAPPPYPGYAPPAQLPPGYGYGYPPPGYAYPPPYYYYPPPGWGAPPSPRPTYPEDAAGQTTPYLDLLMAGVAVDKRYDSILTVGVQGGVYLASRVRVVARVLMFTTEPEDDLQNDYFGEGVLPTGCEAVGSDPPALLFGGAIGVAPVVRRNFVFAPGIGFHTTNVGDYGSLVTLAMPFEWVTDEGTRFGFEIDVGRAFGGRVTGRCFGGSSCSAGEEQEFDRPAAPAFFAAFQLGWGFNHPPAKMPQSSGVP